MNTSTITRRSIGAAVALAATATCAIAPATAAPAPAQNTSATCTTQNPMFAFDVDQLTWKLTATPAGNGRIAVVGTGTAGKRDLVLNQFVSDATLSWNNTTTGKYGSVKLTGKGGNPTLDRTVIDTGKGSVTYNVVIKTGAGTQWIGTQTSTPCVGTITV